MIRSLPLPVLTRPHDRATARFGIQGSKAPKARNVKSLGQRPRYAPVNFIERRRRGMNPLREIIPPFQGSDSFINRPRGVAPGLFQFAPSARKPTLIRSNHFSIAVPFFIT
jgi:hypothetical protein